MELFGSHYFNCLLLAECLWRLVDANSTSSWTVSGILVNLVSITGVTRNDL